MATSTFSMQDLTVIVGTEVISGFSEGEAVRITKRENQVNMVVGADGDAAVNFSNDESVEVTLNLLQTASKNAVVSALANAQRIAGGAGVFISVNGGLTNVEILKAYVQKDSDIAAGKEHVGKSFTFIGVAEVYVVGDK